MLGYRGCARRHGGRFVEAEPRLRLQLVKGRQRDLRASQVVAAEKASDTSSYASSYDSGQSAEIRGRETKFISTSQCLF